ncbi:uncharacterized protein [Antedon mediterranea]|uniref:uncharacterized protein n=1 Tax=Antedon mediterranea TaxID=105859 RepID=UPI003AF84108
MYGGAIYGTADNLLYYLPYNAGQVIAGLLLAIHFGTVMVIMNTPINLYIEEKLNLPRETTWQMCLIRSLVMVTELLVALLIPHYGEFLTLVGAFLALPIVFILPSLFYLRLRNMDDTVPNGFIGMLLNSTAVHLVILAIGIVLCLGSVYSSFHTLVLEGAHLAIPCFVNFTAL